MGGIRIGTLIKGNDDPVQAIISLAPAGFESWSLMFWETLGGADLARLADGILSGIPPESTVSSLSIYGNPLRDDETGEEIRRSWEALIEAAPLFSSDGVGIPLVSGFAGRRPGASVEASILPWTRLFSGLADKATKASVRLAFENCRMGDTWKTGKWNIAINPDAWELMFSALPDPNLGLEWEPCHQLEALADPLRQLESWAGRIFHVHGKDARIDRKHLSEHGLYGKRKFHASCLPGNGDTDWVRLFRILESSGYRGSVDIEGWNDEEWSGDRELPGQLRSLSYLKAARIG